MKINIVGGSGVMGRIHKPILERAGHEVIITGRSSIPSPEEAAKTADLTIISVPIKATKEVIKNIAPNCKAIMDFTSIKMFPIEYMLKYSKKDCEVAGIHPLYGNVPSIKGRTIVFCPTEKTGKRCLEIIELLKKEGALIKKMSPDKHDEIMRILQNLRLNLLYSYGKILKYSGLKIKELIELSPPPTKAIIDLISRQIDEKNDDLYSSIMGENKDSQELEEFIKILKKDIKNIPKELREFYGEELKKAQERAKRILI